MKFIKIQNKGELDIRLVSLMGASTKRDSSGKIGKFGTGLKYSISWLVRNNIFFKLFIGDKEIEFSTDPISIRDQDFQVVTIDGKPSSLTTSMGLDWKGWMILRELYCNAMDEEDGNLVDYMGPLQGRGGYTTFYIQDVGEIAEARKEWTKYFPDPSTKIQDDANFAIYPGTGNLRIYKQGVLVAELEEKSVFNYDIKDCEINELRQYTGYAPWDVSKALANLTPKNIETFIQVIGENHYEANISLDWHGSTFGNNWASVIGEAKVISKKDAQSLKSRGQLKDQTGLLVLPDNITKKLCYKFPHLSAVRIADNQASFYEVVDQEMEMLLKRALAILETCEYEIPAEAKFLFGMFGDPHCMGRVNLDTKEILLSVEHTRRSLFDFITTIIEEVEHIRSGHGDETRAFQQHFINLYTKQLLTQNEIQL